MENSMDRRDPVHAGFWYSDDPSELKMQISDWLSKAEKKDIVSPKAIIVPHAGYRFSGPVAAKAFAHIEPQKFDRVVVMGPSHRKWFEGAGLTSYKKFGTPLGDIPIDLKGVKQLLELKSKNFFVLDERTDEEEHSIEMEAPFLKHMFGSKDFELIPIVMGMNGYERNLEIANDLFSLFDDDKTLFIISSDFCHWGKRFGFVYYDKSFSTIWESTENLDKAGVELIKKFDSKSFSDFIQKYKNTICGRGPITIMLGMFEIYKKKNPDKTFKGELCEYKQSGKVTSMDDSAVSYAAITCSIE